MIIYFADNARVADFRRGSLFYSLKTINEIWNKNIIYIRIPKNKAPKRFSDEMRKLKVLWHFMTCKTLQSFWQDNSGLMRRFQKTECNKLIFPRKLFRKFNNSTNKLYHSIFLHPKFPNLIKLFFKANL